MSLESNLNAFAANFWQQLDQSAGPDGCWLWTGWVDRDGYGRRWMAGKHHGVHRIAYVLANGPLSPGDKVLHSCDVPNCFQPQHLSKGTHLDNMRDRAERNRQARGERNGRCTISEEQAREIIALCQDGLTTPQITARTGIHGDTVRGIRTGRTWKHLQPEPLFIG